MFEIIVVLCCSSFLVKHIEMRLDGIMGNILNMKFSKFGEDWILNSCPKLQIKNRQIPAILGIAKNHILNFNHLLDFLNIKPYK